MAGEDKGQACEPCAKRKVRCDRAEPSCSNCKRRKHDHCVYPDVAPLQRIKQLEATVRALGGNLTSIQRERSSTRTTTPQQAVEATSAAPVILHEAGRSIYLESEGWQTWINASRVHGDSGRPLHSTTHHQSSIHTPGKHLPHAFQGYQWRQSTDQEPSLSRECPISSNYATRLWSAFLERVEPQVKITFEWTLKRLQHALHDSDKWQALSLGEQLQTLSTCLYGLVSLTTKECLDEFGQTRSSLAAEYRTLCEGWFSRINLLLIEDMSTLKALCLYMKANIDLVTIQSLWSLMGLVSRSAERLGVHRDGKLLNLSPIDTEDRRRLWWQLQQIDMILAIKNGVTALTFTAEWDAELPLNIEDSDLVDASGAWPEQRVGLTSFSFTLFTYWIISKQRSFRQNRLRQQTAIDRSMLGPLTDLMIDSLETGLNWEYLQYCDPIHSIDAVIQIAARAVICVLRLRRLHEIRLTNEQLDDQTRKKYFNTCLQSLKYVIANYSQPALTPFRWLAETSFAWHALIGLLVDMSRSSDIADLREAWAVLTDLYGYVDFLMDLSEDRRRAHAASSVVATWSACQNKAGFASIQKPMFVLQLEEKLSQLGGEEEVEDSRKLQDSTAKLATESWDDEDGGSEIFNINFGDIDWAFWDSIS